MGTSTTLSTMISVFVALVHVTALLLLALASIRVFRNLRFLNRVRQSTPVESPCPRVSVLIPARNEEASIKRCTSSLIQQDYPEFEILVLDDQSTDRTWARIEELVAQYPAIRAFRGDHAPPPGWNGKSYACQRLAEHATGEWLLFTDADTDHTPQSISQGIAQAMRLGVDVLSAMPYQMTEGWIERLLVSFIMDFLPILGIDLQHLPRGRGGHAVANGQYLLVRQTAYESVGGHNAIRSALVDDFALARHFVQHDLHIALVSGATMLACRMYHTAGEVWHGFSKNIVLSLQTARRWPIWSIPMFAWGFTALFVLPFILLIVHPDKLLPLVEVIWLLLLRVAAGTTTKRPLAEAAFTPLAALGVMALGLNALFVKLTQRPITWKDRAYPVKQ